MNLKFCRRVKLKSTLSRHINTGSKKNKMNPLNVPVKTEFIKATEL